MTFYRKWSISCLLACVAFATLPTSANAAGSQPTDEMIAPLRAFINAYNDATMLPPKDAFTSDCTTIDIIAPYSWTGDDAILRWWQDTAGAADEKIHARFLAAHVHVTLDEIGNALVKGDRVYLTAKVHLTATIGLDEHFSWIVVEISTPDGWRIQNQAWE